MDSQKQFQKGDTICTLKGVHKKDKKGNDIPGIREQEAEVGVWNNGNESR